MTLRSQSGQAIERATVEQVPTQALGDQAADGALAGATRAVKGQHFGRASGVGPSTHAPCPSSAWLTRSPTVRASSIKPGNEVATLAQSSMTISSLARSDATTKDMAIR